MEFTELLRELLSRETISYAVLISLLLWSVLKFAPAAFEKHKETIKAVCDSYEKTIDNIMTVHRETAQANQRALEIMRQDINNIFREK